MQCSAYIESEVVQRTTQVGIRALFCNICPLMSSGLTLVNSSVIVVDQSEQGFDVSGHRFDVNEHCSVLTFIAISVLI